MDNKRLAPRIKLNKKARIDFVDAHEADFKCAGPGIKADIVDISVNGIGLRLAKNVDEPTLSMLDDGKMKARVNFTLNTNDNPVQTFASLVRHTNSDKFYGLQFLDIPEASHIQIKSVVEKFAFC